MIWNVQIRWELSDLASVTMMAQCEGPTTVRVYKQAVETQFCKTYSADIKPLW